MQVVANVWEWPTRVGATLGVISFGIGILLGLKALGVFNRPSHRLTVGYHGVGALSIGGTPRFIVVFESRGNTPVAFQDFELLLPRLGSDALDLDGEFRLRANGAKLFVDGFEEGHIEGAQAFFAIDRMTRVIDLGPRQSMTEFFDLGQLYDQTPRQTFEPIISFRDSYGFPFWGNMRGEISAGDYPYPHQEELDRVIRFANMKRLRSRKRWLRRSWAREYEEFAVDPAHRGEQ